MDIVNLKVDQITHKGRKITELSHDELLEAFRFLFIMYQRELEFNRKIGEMRSVLNIRCC